VRELKKVCKKGKKGVKMRFAGEKVGKSAKNFV
jgi:hypothetical protein